jgi:ATP-dependent Clp protease ATP-binding subunit ClpA
MFERFTESARRTIVLSQGEAKALMHDHVGPSHLLLGVLTAEGATAGTLLAPLGVDADAVRRQVVARYGPARKSRLDTSPSPTTARRSSRIRFENHWPWTTVTSAPNTYFSVWSADPRRTPEKFSKHSACEETQSVKP